MIGNLALVALGGAVGAVLRHLGVLGAARWLGAGFPYGTLAVNVAGSFLIGVVFSALTAREAMHLAPFLTVGVLGGFTTFSAFSLDALILWERGAAGLAAAYVLASVALSLGAVGLGVIVVRGGLG
ncbi:MAG: CrcB family protein [Rhodobacteraceae bacterium]|nr:CrcB family protein [Paracoccaceae bacterium]